MQQFILATKETILPLTILALVSFALVHPCSCGSVVEHCISSAKGCGFNSQGTHILIKTHSLNALEFALDKSIC